MRLILGDTLTQLKKLSDNSVDAIVTDPPYGYKFMGRKWDYNVPSVAVWKECLRVLKPGGHLLSFAGTRTHHRMCVNIEDAGFEIRDMIAWVYGSGFPKSHNIGKAVDKLQGNDREEGEYRTDGRGKWELKMNREKGDTGVGHADGTKQKYYDTKGTSEWEGWGTALKPALEPITVARKPLDGTVAGNVLKHGTGGLNIDGCRVDLDGNYKCGANGRPSQTGLGDNYDPSKANQHSNIGRFPANFIHDGSDEVVGLFPNSKSTGGSGEASQRTAPNSIYGVYKEGHVSANLGGLGDSGSASRFFYCAKASKQDRDEGLDTFQEKQASGLPMRSATGKRGGVGMDGTKTDRQTKRHNNHPTVKPTDLMRYLCRLVTPPGGVVLDPYIGSGSTGKAAVREGFSIIGIDDTPEYIEIAKARIKHAEKTKKQEGSQLKLSF